MIDEAPVVLSAELHATRLAELRAHAEVSDSIRAQVGELLETRTPRRKWSSDELAAAVAERLGVEPETYGAWVHYPWSRRLVHVLPEAEFFELRTSRNKNKITKAEQETLRGAKCGVAGLSVGQATALTLALEGVGGVLRLADFDTLNLSNMNRLRAGVHEIGVNKATITARAIYEQNPYARVEVFPDGITDANLDRFLDSLDLLFEECDDLKMKVRLREEARRRRIPVLMETSDRGMLDVERFDLEPERPLFHGLAGDLRAEQLAGLTTYQKVPVVLAIIGARTMSPRLAGSLVDVDETLKTWPQLASAVALGGAVNTDVARRVLLGSFRDSGRYFVDVERLIGATAPDDGDDAPVTLPPPPRPAGEQAPEDVRSIVAWATRAPSGGNSQPWRFVYRRGDDTLECHLAPERSRTFLDFEHRASFLALGAAAENARLACAARTIRCDLEALPDPSRPSLAWRARLGTGGSRLEGRDARWAEWVQRRVTNRRWSERHPFLDDDVRALEEAALLPGCSLRVLHDAGALDAFGELHGETERLRMLHPVMHAEMMGELRWSAQEAASTRDGLDTATLELTPTDRAAMEVLRRPSVAASLRALDAGWGLVSGSRKAMAASSAVGLVAIEGPSLLDYYRGGVAVQRVWLEASARGWAFQPMTAMTYVFARLESADPSLDAADRRAFGAAKERFYSLFGLRSEQRGVMAFRLARAGAPTERSLRREVAEVLVVSP